MHDATDAAWRAILDALARDAEADEATLLAFVRGDLVEGRARRVPDIIAYADAWDRLMERAPGLSPATLDALFDMAASVPHGDPMRGLVHLLRAALPEAAIDERVAALAASTEPARRFAAENLRYGLRT
ncbi:MAG: hypothetical protein IT374_02515 [Polyangiaceae bacterium]|nr:hypothetical protein [Polyangiaceae bacterium]